MNRTLPTLALVLAVLLAGCAGLSGSGPGGSTPAPTSTTPAPTTTTTTTATTPAPPTTTTAPPTSTASPTTTTPTATTTTEAWTPPEPPNKPMEGKYDDDNRTRMHSGRFIHREAAPSGDGYTNFDVEVHADTRMENVDPPEHGSVRGEPYFLVYVDDTLVTHTPIVAMKKNGTFAIPVDERALDRFDGGTHQVHVYLMDEDSEYDDMYGIWKDRIRIADS